jgi:hypothetical protein
MTDEAHAIDIRSVKQLLQETDEHNGAWVVRNLIHEGDQVVLAGEAKSGKTFFAIQLAMAVAEGQNDAGQHWFLKETFELAPKNGDMSWLPRPRKVLFFSLEMGPGVIRDRLRSWVPDGDGGERCNGIRNMDALKFVFSIDGQSTLRLQERDKAFQGIQKCIEAEDPKPSLVIFDTFVRVHGVDENDNVKMASVMQNLADLCTVSDDRNPGSKRKIAHIIIHHLRKPNYKKGGPTSVIDAVRGASSILGAADLVLGLDPLKGNKIKLEFMSRHLAEIEDLELEKRSKGKNSVLFDLAPTKPEPAVSKETKPITSHARAAISAVEEILRSMSSDIKEVSLDNVMGKLAGKGFSIFVIKSHAGAVLKADWEYGADPAKKGKYLWKRK